MDYFNQEKVEKLYPEAIMIPAMKIWSLPKNKKDKLQECCESGEYFAELKKDGFFYQYNRTPNNNYLFSRNVSVNGFLSEKLSNVPHIKDAMSRLPGDTIVIGEVYYPGKISKDVTAIMGCLPEEAIRRQKVQGLIHYYIHDIIMYDGIDLKNTAALNRYKILEKVYQKYSLQDFSYIELATATYENIYEAIEEAFENGEEGMVLKRKNGLYAPDKRPAWATIKVKIEDTVDVVCMGFCDATMEYNGKELLNDDGTQKPLHEVNWPYWAVLEKTALGEVVHSLEGQCTAIKSVNFRTIPVTKPFYHGWKTAMRIGAYDTEGNLKEIGTISSGLTDELRADFAKNPSHYIGSTVEVQCMQKDIKEQTLRHGFFIRFRDDKNPESCTLKEVFK